MHYYTLTALFLFFVLFLFLCVFFSFGTAKFRDSSFYSGSVSYELERFGETSAGSAWEAVSDSSVPISSIPNSRKSLALNGTFCGVDVRGDLAGLSVNVTALILIKQDYALCSVKKFSFSGEFEETFFFRFEVYLS